MRIGVILEQPLEAGGGYQLGLTTLKTLFAHQGEPHEFVALTPLRQNIKALASYGIDAHLFSTGRLGNLISLLCRGPLVGRMLLGRLTGSSQLPIERALKKHSLDLIYFVNASNLATFIIDHPVMIRVLDVCHLDWPEFPEIRLNREFDTREDVLNCVAKRAVAVLVDAELARTKLISRYGLDASRVHVLGFEPGDLPKGAQASEEAIASMRQTVGLGDHPFVFYPAQYWPHKNHAYIIRAIKKLADCGTIVHAVFCGSNKGNQGFIEELAKRHEVSHLIHHLGFIEREMIASLYRSALALVMPTWFGPTNIPPLEAFASSCPVLYSDLEGLREQVGDAALLMSLDDPASLAGHLERLLVEPGLRETLIVKGHQRLAELREVDTWQIHAAIFKQFEQQLMTYQFGQEDQ